MGVFFLGHHLAGVQAGSEIYAGNTIVRHKAGIRRLVLSFILYNYQASLAKRKTVDYHFNIERFEFYAQQRA